MRELIPTIVSVMFLFVSPAAFAQNTNDVNAGIQFDFSQSGARSLGMGGAFVALANDSTALYGNPAGLVQLTRTGAEFSGELRHWQWASTVHQSGHAFGPPSGVGLDSVNGLVDQTFHDAATRPSFGAFVMKVGSKVSLGAYGRVLTRYEMTKQTGSEFYNCTGLRPSPPFCEWAGGIDRFVPEKERIELGITSLGGAVAYGTTRLSVGVGLQYATFHMDATNAVYSIDASNFQAVDVTNPANIGWLATQNGDDTAWAVNAGILWKASMSRGLSIGAAFQQGPQFTFDFATRAGPANKFEIPGSVTYSGSNPFKVPNHTAVGLAYEPGPVTVSVEYDRVEFSQLLGDNYRSVFTGPSSLEGQVFAQGFKIDNANEVRAGVEYAFRRVNGDAVFVRGGAFYDPQHQPYFEPSDAQTGYPNPRAVLGFPKGNNQVHRSLGFGVDVAGYRFDFAADFAGQGNTFAASTAIPLKSHRTTNP